MIDKVKQFFVQHITPIIDEYKHTDLEFKKLSDEIGRAIQNQSNYFEDLSKVFQSIFASVQLTAEATQVMEKEIKEIKELSNHSIQALDDVIQTIEQLTEEVHTLTGHLDNVKGHSNYLKNAITEIEQISEMTIVASRNAQIKAYHAGERGRGFEVIARQMVDLVGQTETATSGIPKVTERIESDVSSLTELVEGMQKFLEKFEMIGEYLNDSFKQILTIIPNLERDTTEAARLIAEQEDAKVSLLYSNQELNSWLTDTFELSEKASSALIFLEGLAGETINLAEQIKNWEDASRHNFYYLLNRFQHILSFTIEGHQNLEKKMPQLKGAFDFSKFSNTFGELKLTSQDIKQSIVRQSTDLKKSEGILEASLNTLTSETGVEVNILQLLNEAEQSLNELKDLPDKVLFFESELNAIVERSRILSLYAAIESARAGEFSQPLTVVADEIKMLANQAKTSVTNITRWREALIYDFDAALRIIKECKTIAQTEREKLDESARIITEALKKIKELCFLIDETSASLDQQLSNFPVLENQLYKITQTYEEIIAEFDRYLKTSLALTRNLDRTSVYKEQFQSLHANLIIETEPPVQLTIRESADPIILDPAFKTDVISDRINQQIHIGLFSYNDVGNIVPGATADFIVSEDCKLWTFYLRKDIKFHNGQQLTAHDVLYSIERIKGGPNAGFVEYIDEMTIIDDHTIQFKLRYPYLPILANLSCGTCLILPRHGYDPAHPIGAGPYRFVRWERGQRVVLKANEEFFEGRPPIDELIYRIIPDENSAFMQFRQRDIVVMEIQQLEIDESKFTAMRSPSLSTQYLAINISKETPFKIKEVRLAMNYILDNDKYVKILLKGRGVPAKGIFPPGMVSYNPNITGFPFDPDKAKYLMSQVGFTQGLRDFYEVDTRNAQLALERTEFVCESLAKIGIRTKINPLEWKDLLKKTYSGESLLSMRGWVSDHADPDNFLYPLFHSRSCGESGNITFYKNSEIDKMIETARQIRNFERRMDYYRQIEEKILEDPPWVLLNHGLNYFVKQPDVFNLKIDAFGLVRAKYLYKKRWNK